MLTVSILINGQPLYTRSCFREKENNNGIYEYRVDDGSVINHKYSDGAIILAHKLLDTMYELKRKQDIDKIIKISEELGLYKELTE